MTQMYNDPINPTYDKYIDIHKHISSVVKSSNTDGLYLLQLDTMIQKNSGGNRFITNHQSLFNTYHDIEPYPTGGINNTAPTIYCTIFGLLH